MTPSTTSASGSARRTGTAALDLHWHALLSQAEVLRLADRTADADGALHQATEIAERKGNLVAARLSRESLSPA